MHFDIVGGVTPDVNFWAVASASDFKMKGLSSISTLVSRACNLAVLEANSQCLSCNATDIASMHFICPQSHNLDLSILSLTRLHVSLYISGRLRNNQLFSFNIV